MSTTTQELQKQYLARGEEYLRNELARRMDGVRVWDMTLEEMAVLLARFDTPQGA